MRNEPIILFSAAAKWRAWLEKNHAKSDGVFLRIFKKDAGRLTAPYQDILDEALCFGWIDGVRKSFDEASYLQKFTPRRSRSIWSVRNKEHVARLIAEGRMTAAGIYEIERAKKDGRWDRAYDGQATMQVPADFLQELEKNEKALEFYKSLNKTNRFAVAFRLHNAKKPETRQRRMQQFIDKFEKGEKLV